MSDPRPLERICKQITHCVIKSRGYPKRFREIHRRMLNNVEFCERKAIIQKRGQVTSKSKQMNLFKKGLSNISPVTHLDDEVLEVLTVLYLSRINLKGLNSELLVKIKALNPVLYQEYEDLVAERSENSTKLTGLILELEEEYPDF